ncbi:transposase [Nonomuraea sp. 10N515B]|uniref:transposase n=1 Tax=Nonomuraea sp. 10N515B TaxID=3457422 RepID=UPI003FCE7C6C
MPYQRTGPDQRDLVDIPTGIRLVAFDLDGTLTRGQTCLEAIADAFGFAAQMSVWEQARTEQELTAARLGVWEYIQHLSTEDMDAALATIPLAPGAIEGVTALRTAGIGTIIVSLALSSNVAYFVGRLGVDAHFGTEPDGNGGYRHVLDACDTLELLAKAPDPASATKLTISQISAALKHAHRRKIPDKAAAIQAALRTEQLGRPEVVAAACSATVRSAVAVLSVLNEQIKTLQGQVEAHFGRHPAAEIICSQPGLGPILGARVLAEFGDDPTRYASAKARKNYAGTSPITRASGKKRIVLARFVHNDRLIDALGSQAFAALNVSPGARACYDRLRAATSVIERHCVRSPTVLSGSCTDVSKPARPTTKQPLGLNKPRRLLLDNQAPGGRRNWWSRSRRDPARDV